MQQSSDSISLQRALPYDISFKIASSLQERDVCSLGSCPRFWRDLCRSDSIWASLTNDRWPSLSSLASDPMIQGWKEFYRKTHKDIASRVFVLIETVELSSVSNSLEIGDYFTSVQVLRSTHLSFKDVQFFLFKPNLSLLLNLFGAHYCIFRHSCPERQVCVKWWKLGRWFYGFRMRDESHSRCVSLADLLTENGKEVLGVLHRGAVHEVLRFEITTSNATTSFLQQPVFGIIRVHRHSKTGSGWNMPIGGITCFLNLAFLVSYFAVGSL